MSSRIASCIGVIALIVFAQRARADIVYLDTLEVKNVDQGWGTAQPNVSVDGRPLRISGHNFTRGIGTHTDSEIHLDLAGRGLHFDAWAGIDSEVGENRADPVEFEVLADGKSVWKSGETRTHDDPKHVELDLAG